MKVFFSAIFRGADRKTEKGCCFLLQSIMVLKITATIYKLFIEHLISGKYDGVKCFNKYLSEAPVFGYIKPHIPELRVCEHELYRALYCGLCEAMGKRVTCSSRLTLSYDFVFFALIRAAVSDEKLELESHRCIVHPTKKRPVALMTPAIEYTARAAGLLIYHKLKDDIADGRGIRRMGARLLLPEASRIRKKALRSPLPEEAVKVSLADLAELERNGCASCDLPAETSGVMLAELLSYGFEGAKARIAYEAGLHTGRFVYMADACDDLRDDEKNGSYNPILKLYPGESAEEIIKNRGDDLRCAMTAELMRLEAAVNLIECSDAGIMNIIKNVIYLGMPEAAGRLTRI